MTSIPMSARDLTDYPDELDTPRSEGTPSGTSLRLADLLRAGYDGEV